MGVEGAADVEDEALSEVGDGEGLDVAEEGLEDGQQDHGEAEREEDLGVVLREDVVDEHLRDQGREHGEEGQQRGQREDGNQLASVWVHEDQFFSSGMVASGRRYSQSMSKR